MKTLTWIVKENIGHRDQIWEMAKSHQMRQYRGSDLGFLWAFAKPIMYIVVFYFAISIGFKSSKDISGLICPYFVWLSIGMISFFYMRDMILNGASCFRKYKALVCKVKYPVITLPTSIAISYLLIHLGMLVIGCIISMSFGCFPSIYWIQLPFYMLLMFIMAIAWTILAGLISAVFKDFYNLLQVINQAVFWLSAILFDVNKLSPSIQRFFLFNPITYIVEGYRNAFCRHVWFFEEPLKLACYLVVMFVMILVSTLACRKLIKRIPDIL